MTKWKIHKRYSDFASLREELLGLNPVLQHVEFPDKTWLRSSATDFTVMETRREQLYRWLKVALRLCPRAALLQTFFHPPVVGAAAPATEPIESTVDAQPVGTFPAQALFLEHIDLTAA